jgi:hypothetical protein
MWLRSFANHDPIQDGPRGTRQKKLQNWDPVQLEGTPKGLHADIGSLKRFRIIWTSGLAKKVFYIRQALSNYKARALRKSITLDICIKIIYIPLTIPANVIPYIGTDRKASKRRSLLVV